MYWESVEFEFKFSFEVLVEEVKDFIFGVKVSIHQSVLLGHAFVGLDHQPLYLLQMRVLLLEGVNYPFLPHVQNFEDLVRSLS